MDAPHAAHEQLVSLASSLRRSIEALMARQHDGAAIRRAEAAVSDAEAALAQGTELSLDARFRRFGRDMFDRPEHVGVEFESFARSPVAGHMNPHSMSTSIRRTDDGVEAIVELGVAHEGAPGRAHGGFTAAMFDEVMGAAQKVIGRHGFTRSLTIEYLAPFPIGRPVVFRVGLESSTERAFTISGTASVDDTIIATSIGSFTEVTAERFVRT